jgi:hypothetical protein
VEHPSGSLRGREMGFNWAWVNWVNWAGLWYDIAGAFLLGRAVVFNSTEKIAQQVMTAWDYNKHLIGVVVEGKVEATVGLGLLILGFLLQGASGGLNEAQWLFWVEVGVLVAIMIVHRLTLPYFVRRGTDKVVAYIRSKQPDAKFITQDGS